MTKSLVVFGLSLSSSWGNGHASTFRGLLRALAARGWIITFFEQDVEWYRSNRDLPDPGFCDLRLYSSWPSPRPAVQAAVRQADAVIIGSLVADGQTIVDWLVRQDRPLLFYDIDTPITLVELRRSQQTHYLRADQVPLFDVYFSFAGGPALTELEHKWRCQHAEALYCGVDTLVYRPVPADARFECTFSYMGTYTPDRQAAVEELLMAPARSRSTESFLLAGPQYPPMELPPNLRYEPHIYPCDHAAFFGSSRATLNVTRGAMRAYGWAPSTRLFEAAASGACIISDVWPGLNQLFEPDVEVLLADNRQDVLRHLDQLSPMRQARIGAAARDRVLREHTYARRAEQVDAALQRCLAAGEVQKGKAWASAS